MMKNRQSSFLYWEKQMASKWIQFVQAYYKKNKSKGISYKTAMVQAAKLYKSQKGKAAGSKKVQAEIPGAQAPKKKRRKRKQKVES